MDSVAITVPLRPPMKKMKKRKELDALAPSHVISRRTSGKRSSQELLTDSSDEHWNVSVRGNRKARARRTRPCPTLLRACSAFFGCAAILATASLIWLFIDVRQQLTSLRTEVDQGTDHVRAIAGSEGVPDALQKCHSLYSLSKDLQNNQTILFTQLTDVKAQITNLTSQLSGLQKGLHTVQEYLQSAPKLSNDPNNLDAVINSVASFGSRIQDLEVTVGSLKDAETKLLDAQHVLQQNITDTTNTLTELSRRPATATNTQELNHTISQMKNTLLNINNTLWSKIDWVTEDRKKDRIILDGQQDKTNEALTMVGSLEASLAKANKEQTAMRALVADLTDKVNKAEAMDLALTGRVKKLEFSYSNLQNSTDVLIESMSSTKKLDVKNEMTNSTTAKALSV